MKLMLAVGVAAMCAASLGAQSGTTTTKTKVDVKDGKDVEVTGCLERNPGGGYMITNKDGDLRYALVTNDDLSKHLGHRVEVQGTAADKGDGKVKIESTVKSGDEKTQTTSEVEGHDMKSMKYLGVKSVTMISSSCS
jgi:hypothetical protein